MSNYLAIAAVTMTLRDLLEEEAKTIVSGAQVTTLRPEKAADGADKRKGANIFLYQVTPNAAWRNQELISHRRDVSGPDNRAREIVGRSQPVALNLQYLLSFYGDETTLEPQRLLGSAVAALQRHARLPVDRIAQAIKDHEFLRGKDADHKTDLPAESYLDFQAKFVEQVRLTPISLNLEELSKLWSVFFQVPYTLSVAYEAAVVLIEPQPPREAPIVSIPPKPAVGPEVPQP